MLPLIPWRDVREAVFRYSAAKEKVEAGLESVYPRISATKTTCAPS